MTWIIVFGILAFVVWKVFFSSGTTKREQNLVERQVQSATPEHRKEMREHAESTLKLLTSRGQHELLSNSNFHEVNVAIEVLTHLDAHDEGVGDDPAFRLRRRLEYQRMTKQSISME